MTRIHATAIVDATAQLDPSVEVGPYAIIESGVVVGANTAIGPHVWLRTGTTIGQGNRIDYGAIIGHWPQDLAFTGAPSYVRIGDRNTIREYVTIHRGTKPESVTTIGSGCFLMAQAHVGHNCTIGNDVIIVNNTLLAGHVEVHDQALLSGQCVVHQFARIGRLAMLSGMTGVGKDVPPFCLAAMRNNVVGLNVVGLRRAGITPAVRQQIKQAFRFLYLEGLSLPHAIEQIQGLGETPELQQLLAFLRTSQRGILPHRARANALPEEELSA